MIGGVWGNLRECTLNKPPLVVFSASIIAFAFTLVAVSLYIETHKNNLINPDVKVNIQKFYILFKIYRNNH